MQNQLQEQIEQIKGRKSKHLDRIDRRTITTYTTISEIRAQIHKIENTLESNNITMEQPDRPGWTFPGNMVELHTAEDTSSLNSEVMNAQTGQQQTSEQDLVMGDIPDRLSPVRNYVPAGAEEEESS